MALPGLVSTKNLADVADRERTWDNLGLNIGADFSGVTTPESTAYIEAVEAADAAFLEEGVKAAIHAFVVGCKIDGIWPAIKASCILAGARTLNGALVPLVGAAPTNVGPFVAGDYNRETGLVGNGTSKYLNTNRNNNVDPQDNSHHSVYCQNNATGQTFIGPISSSVTVAGTAQLASGAARNRNGTINGGYSEAVVPSFVGMTRNNSADFILRINGVNNTAVRTSQTPNNTNLAVFGAPANNVYSSARLAFYSIGESLNLALLEARVTTLINAFAAAIP